MIREGFFYEITLEQRSVLKEGESKWISKGSCWTIFQEGSVWGRCPGAEGRRWLQFPLVTHPGPTSRCGMLGWPPYWENSLSIPQKCFDCDSSYDKWVSASLKLPKGEDQIWDPNTDILGSERRIHSNWKQPCAEFLYTQTDLYSSISVNMYMTSIYRSISWKVYSSNTVLSRMSTFVYLFSFCFLFSC